MHSIHSVVHRNLQWGSRKCVLWLWFHVHFRVIVEMLDYYHWYPCGILLYCFFLFKSMLLFFLQVRINNMRRVAAAAALPKPASCSLVPKQAGVMVQACKRTTGFDLFKRTHAPGEQDLIFPRSHIENMFFKHLVDQLPYKNCYHFNLNPKAMLVNETLLLMKSCNRQYLFQSLAHSVRNITHGCTPGRHYLWLIGSHTRRRPTTSLTVPLLR